MLNNLQLFMTQTPQCLSHKQKKEKKLDTFLVDASYKNVSNFFMMYF